jgi:hypothetical protein
LDWAQRRIRSEADHPVNAGKSGDNFFADLGRLNRTAFAFEAPYRRVEIDCDH